MTTKATNPAALELNKFKATPFEQFRETLESVAVAFILAFGFKAFLAEAFVIPTGSMAPTLQGRHFDLVCPECQNSFRHGASTGFASKPQCPNCRYTYSTPIENRNETAIFNGDRILVNKFIYDFDEPQRWDVIVFKYPHDAKTNYIKRLIGLPGEHLQIRKGDIYVAPIDAPIEQLKMARKPDHRKLQAMLQEVHDQDHVHQGLIKRGWPVSWIDWSTQPTPHSWKSSEDLRSFTVTAAEQTSWLRYRHLMPNNNHWDIYQSTTQNFVNIEPQLIRDNYAYNYGSLNCLNDHYWVGDLALKCELETTTATGKTTLELVKGGERFQAVINHETRDISLVIPGREAIFKNASWPGPGTHQILFANVDDQLTLLVDGEPIFTPQETTYDHLGNDREVETGYLPGSTTASDLAPVGIGHSNSQLTVKHLRVLRDVYYTPAPTEPRDFTLQKYPDNPELDQFIMLGDNSPASADSRLWGENYTGKKPGVQYFVERRQLMGKALFVYWPHGWPFSFSKPIPMFGTDIYIPFYPNFSRMKFIR